MQKRIKQISRVSNALGTGELVTERWGFQYAYEGLQVKRNRVFLAKQQFNQTDVISRNGKIVKFIGNTQDIIKDDLSTDVRGISLISGRDKQVKNKVANGEQRRKRCENQLLSFGVSKSKSFHKNKHKQS